MAAWLLMLKMRFLALSTSCQFFFEGLVNSVCAKMLYKIRSAEIVKRHKCECEGSDKEMIVPQSV